MSRNGYTKLASLMGAHTETMILRRFGSLNAQNLLYYQAELVHLEEKLQKLVKANAESGHDDRSIYDRDWQTLSEAENCANGDAEHWRTVQEVRRILKEYSLWILFGGVGKRCVRLMMCQMKLSSCRR
jgi:hypothetical protein